jgi:putative membrane protein
MATTQGRGAEPTENRKFRLFFTGLSMGLADLVPGVSGGTIAFLLGIYEELLYSIKLLTGQVPKLLLGGKIRQAFQLIPFGFLVPLGLGMTGSIFGLVHAVSYFLDSHPFYVWSLFFGLVLGSVYVVSRRVTAWTWKRIALLVLGFILTYVIVGLPSTGGSEAPLAIFATGAIAITAMILPGISGSLIMVLLGQYEIIINAVSDRDVFILSVFAIGVVVGLALFVRLLTWLLKHYHFAVIAFLIGVMGGSLRRIWPWQAEGTDGVINNLLPTIEVSFLWAVILMLAGFLIVYLLERAGITKEHVDIDTQEFKKELEFDQTKETK